MVEVESLSKTPLTDAVVLPVRQTNDLTYERLVKHARKLERDRAELIEALRKLADHVTADGAVGHGETPVVSARALLARLES